MSSVCVTLSWFLWSMFADIVRNREEEATDWKYFSLFHSRFSFVLVSWCPVAASCTGNQPDSLCFV